MVGFLAFSGLSRIAGRIQKLDSISWARQLPNSKNDERFIRSVAKLHISLNSWQAKLPREFLPEAQEKQLGSNLMFSVIVSVVHAGSTIKLHK